MSRPKVNIADVPRERLQQILGENKISQRELCSRIGISQQTISRIANGYANLTWHVANLIHEEFPEYSVAWIMGFSEHDTQNPMDATITIPQREFESLLSDSIKLGVIRTLAIMFADDKQMMVDTIVRAVSGTDDVDGMVGQK